MNDDRNPALRCLAEHQALEETAHLLRSPANVRRLLESLDQARAGKVQAHTLDR